MKTWAVAFLVAVSVFVGIVADKTEEREEYGDEYPVLKNFRSFVNDFTSGKDGKYNFAYHVGHSERAEERNEDGEVTGQYAFVAPEGDEYLFKYNADDEGYRVESDALPEAPEDTDDVKKAREEFFVAYQKALELAEEDDYEYSEESDEDSESDEDDESSEESSEEDSDEDSDEDSEEEDEEEEEEEEEEAGSFPGYSHFGFRVPIPYNRK